MKIRKILLYNFKNFRNETVIDFSDGITFLVDQMDMERQLFLMQ